jgi:putative flippase GtrA
MPETPEPPGASSAPSPADMPRHRRSLPIYVGAGGVATGAHYAVTITAVEVFAVAPVLASALGFAVGATVKYWLNYSAAFRSNAPHAKAVSRFVVGLAILMAANTGIFAVLEKGLGMHYVLAQVITTILLIPPGYVLNRQWVFRA